MEVGDGDVELRSCFRERLTDVLIEDSGGSKKRRRHPETPEEGIKDWESCRKLEI